MPASPNALEALFFAARPKTWIAGVSPVFIGAALASREGPLSIPLFLCTLFFSLFIQIGTNYANDYYDHLNGVDHAGRQGPSRAVASGWLSPDAMRLAFIVFFAAAFFISLPLVLECGTWAFLFVFSSIAFGILYTGGPRPLGYCGLGEPLVLLYFGPIAILGTYFVQRHTLSWPLLFLSFAPGLLSTAVLIANNLRDEHTDRETGKNTLVVRFGRSFGRFEYTFSLLSAPLIALLCGFYLPLLTLPLAALLLYRVFTYYTPREILSLLPQTALLF
ncbi:MAG: 1,4-dihydroxy-2-naphthoate octaprenyltransferase, partial [Verrucomicrobiota bacterium]|nr:1,4-dihydroxy-2-naphthoate octaprenyltransferase [Verrucomicrobiota bacterium]